MRTAPGTAFPGPARSGPAPDRPAPRPPPDLGRVVARLLPLVLALVLAATLVQAVGALEARGLGRGQAALATTVSSAVVVFGAAAMAIIAIGGSVAETRDVAEAGARQTGVTTVADVVAAFGAGLTTEVGLATLDRGDPLTLPRLDTNDLPRDSGSGVGIWTELATSGPRMN